MITETSYGVDGTFPLRQAVEDVFEVYDVTVGRDADRTLRLRGRLLTDSARAFDLVTARFGALGYTALFRRDPGGAVILAVPGHITPSRSRLWLALLMFGLTAVSTLLVGGFFAAEPASDGGFNLLGALAFAVPMLGILLAHEMGHFTVARLLGAPVSFPFFIPFPLPPFGTLGAFIQMKAPPRSRRDLLAVAAAGPLSGMIVAVPVLLVGLALSRLGPIPLHNVSLEGNSILYALFKAMLFGRFLPSGGIDVMLHPMALAGWGGLLVTGLNLIPAGQLDGGHSVYALLGDRARAVTLAIVAVLVLAGLTLWPTWLVWALLVYLFGRFHMAPLDDVSNLDGLGVLLALLMLMIFVLVFTPIPWTVIP